MEARWCNKVHRASRIKRSSIIARRGRAFACFSPRERGILFRALGVLSTAKNFHKTAICYLRHRLFVFLLPSFPLCPRNFLSSRSEPSTFLTLVFHSRFSLLVPLYSSSPDEIKDWACARLHASFVLCLKGIRSAICAGFCYVCFSTRTCLLAMRSTNITCICGFLWSLFCNSDI